MSLKFPDNLISFADGRRTINPGAMVLLSEGEYSSYSVKGLFCVLKPIEESITIAAYKQAHPDQCGYDFYGSDLTLWLEAEDYVERQWYIEWHIEKKYQCEKMTIELLGPGAHLPVKDAGDY